MPTKLQLRRGSTSDHSSFTGAVGEVTIDTDKDTLVVHDGSTAGGFVVPRLSDISVTDSGGDGSLSYNNSTGVLTYTGPSASEVRAHITAGAGISVSSGVVTLDILDEDNFSTDSATKAPSQQSTKAYIASQIATKDNTDEMTEGSTNLYFTNSRADARISNALKDEDNMASDSATHLPSQQSVKAYVDAQTTDETAEGSSNLYFTTARVDSQIDSYLNAGTGITLAGSGAVAVNTSVIPTITAMNSAIATSISNLVDSSPDALNTLNELAAALGDDANFSTTVTNSIATKAPLASAALTGTPTAPTASTGTNTTQLATTAYVKQEIDALKALLYAYDQS
tara:strand:- start:38923 stop:39942 length:1020 start_codon:yes stop_codon:yes gene_type:complete